MSNLFEEAQSFESLMAQVVGAGSVCWKPMPTGEFNTENANYIVGHAVERLNQLILDEFAKALLAIGEQQVPE